MRSYRQKQKPWVPDDPWCEIISYMPRSSYTIVRDASEDLRIPVSRLIALALDNELDSLSPFSYPCPVPEAVPGAHRYAEEAGRLLAFIKKFPNGVDLPGLVLCRRELDIPDRHILLAAYAELMADKLIEEFKPQRGYFNYGSKYRRVRATGITRDQQRRGKFRRVEGKTTRYERAKAYIPVKSGSDTDDDS